MEGQYNVSPGKLYIIKDGLINLTGTMNASRIMWDKGTDSTYTPRLWWYDSSKIFITG